MQQGIVTTVRAFMADHKIPGLALAVVKEGRPVAAWAAGRLCLGQPHKVTVDTAFHLASVTKLFVTLAAMRLVEAGRLDLDRPVVSYLPHFKLDDRDSGQITAAMILSHISGMPDYDSDPWRHPCHDDEALRRFVCDFVVKKRLTARPAETYQYCNTAFEVMGDLIAHASGMVFETYVHDYLLSPLKMTQSTLFKPHVPSERLARGHEKIGDEIVPGKVYPYCRMHAPSSTMLSCAADMQRFLMVNLNRGEIDGERILSTAVYEKMWQAAGKAYENIGIGWHRRRFQDELCVYHSGSDPGFRSYLALLPDRNCGVFIAANLNPVPLDELVTEVLTMFCAEC